MGFLGRHAGVTWAVTAAAVVAGLCFGSVAGREVAARYGQAQLDQYAARLVADEEASASELRTALAAVGASQHEACSTTEIAYFRALIFESEFVKDAGRMVDGRIHCSAALGRPGKAIAAGSASFTQQDGTEIYLNAAAYANSGIATITLARDGSYVVFTPLTRLHLEPVPMHFTETATDAPTQRRGRLLGEDLGASPEVLNHEGLVRTGQRLYATRCSIRFFDCVTTSTTVDEMIGANQERYAGGMALGGLIFGLAGFAFSSFYSRAKGLDQQLRRAIPGGRIRVAYQPIVELDTGRIAGAEALARWSDEDGNNVPPDIFVRMAEERGLIGDLTRVVVQRVLRDFCQVLGNHPDFRVSVNITATDLVDPRFPAMLEGLLDSARVNADRLVLEITESSTVRQQQAMEAISLLRAKGHSVHIDDFGTGYSSLAYLQDLKVDAIKIDRAFTQAIGTDSVTSCILPQILSMVQTLHLAVVVEGVETPEQAAYFRDAELPVYAQGWYFGKPQPFWEFLDLLNKGVCEHADESFTESVPASAA